MLFKTLSKRAATTSISFTRCKALFSLKVDAQKVAISNIVSRNLSASTHIDTNYHPDEEARHSSNEGAHQEQQETNWFNRRPPKLYEDHIPTNIIQKALLTAGSGITAITDPYRDDMVAVFGETTGYYALVNLYQQMKRHPEGRDILEERPRINSQTLDLEYMRSLPQGSLAHEYLNFMESNKISADTRKPVHFVDDPDLAYVLQRYREIHDFIHTLVGFPINIMGEVAVKWIEAIQTNLPMCWLAAVFGPVQLKNHEIDPYTKIVLPWALECGHKAKPLLFVYYERRWEQNIDELRRELNIPPLPAL